MIPAKSCPVHTQCQQHLGLTLQELQKLCSGPEEGVAAFLQQVQQLPAPVTRALLGAFRYLKGLGLEVWNESGLTLRPMTQPGHMCLSSNALAQLNVLEGAAVAKF